MAIDQRTAEACAKQEIIELRMRYAWATDLLASGDADKIAAGRAIYHDIYTTDATIGADGIDPVKGADAWVEVVEDALETYNATQHQVGSALVQSLTLPDANGKGGEATMTSYLQAWHSTPENSLYMYVGTYHDRCVHSPENGWQIASMHLENIADEIRTVTPR